MNYEMKFYVYALDAEMKKITAAISFPDEASAEEAYMIARRKMGGDNAGVFRFGYTSTSQVNNEWDVNFYGAEVELKIVFLSLPGPRYPKGMETHRLFKIDKFVEAEKRTKEILGNPRRRSQRDIQFMRHVASVMEGSIVQDTENVANSKSTPQPVKQKGKDNDELRGKKMAAAKFAIENPDIKISLIQQQYGLEERALSRKPYSKLIKEGRKITRNQSGRSIASKDEKDGFYEHKNLVLQRNV